MNGGIVMVIECFTYVGQDDDQRIIFVEKKTLAANDERVKKYQIEYARIQAYVNENGYRIVDVAQVSEEDYANVNGRSR